MATTAEGSRLTEAHRRSQLRVRRQALREILTLWPMLDPADLDRTFPPFSRAAEALIASRRRESSGLAAAYYRAFRSVEGVEAADLRRIVRTAPFPTDAVRTSLVVTGPATMKKATGAGRGLAAVSDLGLAAVSGAAIRHVLDGGRQTLAEATQRDPGARGYARVTGKSPCAFCAMLASRPAVYGSSSFAASNPRFTGKGKARVHDNCGCSLEPVFSTRSRLPGRGQEFADLWEESTAGYSGDDAVNAFRRAYERGGRTALASAA